MSLMFTKPANQRSPNSVFFQLENGFLGEKYTTFASPFVNQRKWCENLELNFLKRLCCVDLGAFVVFKFVLTKCCVEKMLRQSFRHLPSLNSRIGIRYASALSNATVANLEKRWEDLPEIDQKDIIAKLSSRQSLPWKELTSAEKKAAWYISFGAWGPRKPIHTKEDKIYIFWGTTIGLALCAVFFVGFRSQRNIPKTMNREWQEKSDEILKEKNANPFTGYSQVQSK